MNSADSDELLDRQEFERWLRSFNAEYTDTEVENIFDACDVNRNGFISMQSIMQHMQQEANQEDDYAESLQLYEKEVESLTAENEELKHKIKTTIPKLQKEKFDLEMKFSKLEKRARMLEDDNGKLTSDVALLRNLEEQFRQTERGKEETEQRLAKMEADASRYRNMWEADRDTVRTLREENSELINTVTKLNLAKDKAQSDIKQMQIQLDNANSLKSHLEETLQSHLDAQDSHADEREDLFLEREKTFLEQINQLRKEVMDLKLERRRNSSQVRSYEKLPALPLNYTSEGLEGESLGAQLGELAEEDISSMNRIRELKDENILLKEQNAKLSKLVSDYETREATTRTLGLQHSATIENLVKQHGSTVETLMAEKSDLHNKLNAQIDAHHELLRRLSDIEQENRSLLAKSVNNSKSLETVELRNQVASLKRKSQKEKESLEQKILDLEEKLSRTPGKKITIEGNEVLEEIREKLGDEKMSGVYHCLEVGMSYQQIKQLVNLKSDLHLSGNYLRLGFHFNEVKILGPASNKPHPEFHYTWTLKKLGMLVSHIRKMIDIRANLKQVVKCQKAGVPFDEIEDLLTHKVTELDHVAQCYEAGMKCSEIKDIWETRSPIYMPLFGVANCFAAGFSLEQIKELSKNDIYLYGAAQASEVGFAFDEILELGHGDLEAAVMLKRRCRNLDFKAIVATLRSPSSERPPPVRPLIRSESDI